MRLKNLTVLAFAEGGTSREQDRVWCDAYHGNSLWHGGLSPHAALGLLQQLPSQIQVSVCNQWDDTMCPQRV